MYLQTYYYSISYLRVKVQQINKFTPYRLMSSLVPKFGLENATAFCI